MKTYLVLGGYGEMGRITVHDLFETTRDRIIVAGHDLKKAREFARSFQSKRVKPVSIDVTKTKPLAALMKKCDVVINGTQYTENLCVMAACEMARKLYLDLGGLFHMTKRQLKLHTRWKKKGLLAILGCGGTPGITNVLAAYGASLLDTVREIHIRFADYDASKGKTHFVLPYSIATLFDEFRMPSAILQKGKLKFVPAMTGREQETFPAPVGTVTEFNALHSELATFPSSFKNKGLSECTFKVSFPDDFIHNIQLLIELGFAKKENLPFIKKLMSRFLPKGPIRDLEFVRVRMKGTKSRKPVHLVLDAISKSHSKWNAPAGTYNTGVPPSIIAQMICRGKIQKHGVYPPEQCIEPKYFFKELAKRGIKIVIKKMLKN